MLGMDRKKPNRKGKQMPLNLPDDIQGEEVKESAASADCATSYRRLTRCRMLPSAAVNCRDFR